MLRRAIAAVVIAAIVALTAVGVASAAPTGWHLSIPKAELNTKVMGTTKASDLDHGPGFYTGMWTRPHHHATVAIAGHHLTKTHPFRHLDRVRFGDRAVLRKGKRRYVYRMVRRFRVPGHSSTRAVVGNVQANKLVTSTCSDGARFRLVVVWLPQHVWEQSQARKR